MGFWKLGSANLCNTFVSDEEVLEFLKFHKREYLYLEYVKRVWEK
jgi:hypothetical protein